MMRPAAGRIGYFGKIPARSDFIKAADDVALMGVLDQWLAQVMSALSQDARWKIKYDAMAPLSFAFLGTRRRHAIGGHIVPSQDASGRRFPFLLMRRLDVHDAMPFVRHSPLALAPLWQALASLAGDVLAAGDPTAALQAIPEHAVAIDEASAAAALAFCSRETMASLTARLDGQDVAGIMLAIGLLLQPLMHSHAVDVDKSFVLPLPHDAALRPAVAAFWLALVAVFVADVDVELALFLTRLGQQSAMVLGFRGASVPTLQAIIDPALGEEQHVTFDDTAWVADQLDADHDVRALASYLAQPDLSLQVAFELFLQTFTGA